MNPFWGGFDRSAFAGEVISLLSQTSMYTYELAPVASLIEQELMGKMCKMASFPEGSTGVLTTGGSNGNMLGLLCARQVNDPDTLLKGSNGQQLVCFVSAESHYSVLMSANVLGLGYDNCVKVATDDDGIMRMDSLEECV